MKQGVSKLTIYFALLLISSVGAADQEGDERAARLLELVPPDAVSDADVFETHGVHVKSSRNKELDADLTPTGNQFEALIIEADGVFNLVMEKGRPMSSGGGIGIFHRSSGSPMLTAADRNGDGRVDILTYSVLDEDGEVIRDIVDYDADGQANLQIEVAEGYAEIWHLDRWHVIEKQDGVRGIIVDGAFKEIQNIGNELKVK